MLTFGAAPVESGVLTLNLPPDIDINDGLGEPDWERSERLLMARLLKPGMYCVDAGANVGDYALLMARLVGEGGRVYAFEPCAETYQRLVDRCCMHDAMNVRMIERALWSSAGPRDFSEFPTRQSTWNSLGMPAMEVNIARRVQVQAVALGEFWAEREGERPMDFLKLDVEGAEFDAMAGAASLLERKLVRVIQFEISQRMLDGCGRTADAIFKQLHGHGFRIHRIAAGGLVGDAVELDRPFYENFIAFGPGAGPIPPNALRR